MYMFPFQAVVVVQALCVNERRAAFPVLCENLFGVFLPNLFTEFRKLGPGASEGNNILG